MTANEFPASIMGGYIVAGFSWMFRRNPGYVRGQMQFLLNRAPDPVLARLSDVNPVIAEQALTIIAEAFGIPKSQRYCLRPDDKLLDLYHSIYPPGFPDCLDFNYLNFNLERALGRKLPENDVANLTVAGLTRALECQA